MKLTTIFFLESEKECNRQVKLNEKEMKMELRVRMSQIIDEFVGMGNMLSREHVVSRTCRNRLLNQNSKYLLA
jgi:hypothetical protein